MNTAPEHNEKITKLTFAKVYPLYVTKVQRKGRTIEELHQAINWLKSFDEQKMKELIDLNVTFETFFQQAKLNPNAI